jgi:hypothetical protein
MAWGEDEAIGPDVASAGLHVSERIGRDAAAQPDLEEALEASRYASHPYSSHPKEVSPAPAAIDLPQRPFRPRFSLDSSLTILHELFWGVLRQFILFHGMGFRGPDSEGRD